MHTHKIVFISLIWKPYIKTANITKTLQIIIGIQFEYFEYVGYFLK